MQETAKLCHHSKLETL